MAILQYAKKNEVVFIGDSLFPDKNALCYLSDTDVTKYCQPGNQLVVTSNVQAANLETGVGLVNGSTFSYSKVMATSNNIVYLDQNYLTVKIGQYATTALTDTLFKPKDIVCQTTATRVLVNNPTSLTPGRWGEYSAFLNNYGVDTWDGSKDWTREFRLLFPASGWYQFTFNADEYFQGWIDGVEKIPDQYCDRKGMPTVKFFWIEAGGHNIKFRLHNTSSFPQSLGLVIRGPGTEAYNDGVNIPLPGGENNNFSLGYWNGGSWSAGIQYDKLIFRTRYEPDQVTEYQITPTFVGAVEYYDRANNVIAIRPEYGLFNRTADDEGSTIRLLKDGVIKTTSQYWANVNTAGVIYGNVHPAGSTVYEVANPVVSPSQFTLTSNSAVVSEYSHLSGIISYFNKPATELGTANLVIQGNISSNYIGTNIKLQDSDGNWTIQTISNINNNNEIILSGTMPQLASNSHYGIGNITVDDYGVVCGMFNVPEGTDNKIVAGQNLFKVTDNSDNKLETMVASATYTTGTLSSKSRFVTTDKTQQTSTTIGNGSVIELRKNWSRRGYDPLAQVFYVPGINVKMNGEYQAPYGMYASSVDLWFTKKPLAYSNQPVIVRIVEVVNDIPTNRILGESIVKWKDIIIPTNPATPYSDANGTLSEVVKTYTRFRFPDPIYLNADTKYAITVTSDSPDYKVFLAETDKAILGTVTSTSTGRRVVGEPYIEQFYKSQNASLWTPVPNTDLMFRLNKCQFNQGISGTVRFRPANQSANINMDSIIVKTLELNKEPTSTSYRFKANNALNQESDFESITPDELHSFGYDLKTSSKSSTKRREYFAGDKNSATVEIDLYTTAADVSPIVNTKKLRTYTIENVINDAAIQTNSITITDGGRHYDTANIVVTFSTPDDVNGTPADGYANLVGYISNTDIVIDYAGNFLNVENVVITFSEPTVPTANGGQNANAYIITTGSGGISASDIYVDVPGSGYYDKAPTITFTEPGNADVARANVALNVQSIIVTNGGSGYYKNATVTIEEDLASWATSPVNATANVFSETDSVGGNALTRYISKRVDLAPGFNAGDLRVFVDCVRPSGTNVNVYYKVKSPYDGETFEDKKWQLMDKVNDVFSPDQNTVIEIEYKPTTDAKTGALYYIQDGVTYPTGGVFNQFAIKIVLTAGDPTVVPVVTNLAAIAVPAG